MKRRVEGGSFRKQLGGEDEPQEGETEEGEDEAFAETLKRTE